MADKIYLADGVRLDLGKDRKGYNDNYLIIGQTGSGKTMSINLPTALHINEISCVLTLSKRKYAEMLIQNFKEKGYKVLDLNLADPQNTEVIYDPLDYVRTDEDAKSLAEAMVFAGCTEKNLDPNEKYWQSSAQNVLIALIEYFKMTDVNEDKLDIYDLYKKFISSFEDVIDLSSKLVILREENSKTIIKTDNEFNILEANYGDCFAVQNYRTIRGLAPRTASCIISILNEVLSSFMSPAIKKLFSMNKPHVDFADLGTERTVLIVTTSAINTSLSRYIAIMYYQIFKSLFEKAESSSGSLAIPVHVMVDDFGNNCIPHLEEYASIFREAGVSFTIFIQSERQMNLLYGSMASTIIKENCGTITYLSGAQTLEAARELAERLDIPLKKILTLPMGKVIICRAGHDPIVKDRYKTLEDELYKKAIEAINQSKETDEETKIL